jgi:hypothetical protein
MLGFVGPIIHARHSNFPETQPRSLHAPSRHAGRRRVVRSATVMVTARRFGSWIERAPSHRMTWRQLSKAQTRPCRPQTRTSRADERSRRGAESVVEGAVEGSARIWTAGTGTFEHWGAGPAPCGARTVAQSTWRDAQPTRVSKNRCPAHSLGRAEVIRASTCQTLSTRQVGRQGDF